MSRIVPAFDEYPAYPMFVILYKFIFSELAIAPVTVNELSVVLFVTARAFSVVVPAGTLNPPLETVTVPVEEGFSTMLDVADMRRLLFALMAIEPNCVGVPGYAWVVRTPKIKRPDPPAPPDTLPPPPPPPPPVLANPAVANNDDPLSPPFPPPPNPPDPFITLPLFPPPPPPPYVPFPIVTVDTT